MKHRILGVFVAATYIAAAPRLAAAGRPETPRDLYTRAMTRERIVRDEANKPTLEQMRRVVALYESLVRRHPASGYCDNALWQAANLSSLAYERFGDDADRKTAARLLTMLRSGYPSSKLVPQANEALASLDKPAPTATAEPDTEAETAPAPPIAPVKPMPPTGTQKSRADGGSAALATLKEVRRSVLPDGVRLTVELDTEVAYHQEEIANPRRVFFDLKNVKAAPGLQDTSLKFDDDVVREIRLGRHPRNTTRLVVDLDGVASYTVYPLYGPYRLVIDCRRTVVAGATAASAAAVVGRPIAAKALPAVAFDPPPLVQARAEAPAALGVPTRTTVPTTAPVTSAVEAKRPLASSPAPASLPPAAPAANSNGKFSLSRQLGLGVSRVVIDAGHGGHDPGAHGNGINEAELTLDVAVRLRSLLEQSGVEVVMTRDTDVFIPLEERTAIANRAGADLFLSIHANASRNVQARGIETYFLNFAMNPEAEAVAARENAMSVQPMHSLPDIVKAIALNNKINESRDLAETVQKSMVKRLGSRNRTLRDLGVKQAPFVVLIGAGMPSVLAEISFVTNRQDGTLLKTQAYRQQIAQALMDAVVNYQQSLKRMNGISGKKATNQ
jgi:N-acetylmuramoyl-L-alanine amidase